MTAADYSTARPGGAALRAAGITDVGRYLGVPGDPRVLELPEYQDLRAHGINVWVNREGSATAMLLGYGEGVYHGQTAAANLRRLGLDPTQTVVYSSADFDAQPAQFYAMDAYMDGFRVGLGSTPDFIGTYGSMPWINHCRMTGKATWFWQSASTSFTHGQTGFIHIQQTTLPSLAGTDNNILHAAEYGQIGVAPQPVPVPPAIDPGGNMLIIYNAAAGATPDNRQLVLLTVDGCEIRARYLEDKFERAVFASSVPPIPVTACDQGTWDGILARVGYVYGQPIPPLTVVASGVTVDLTDAQLQTIEQGVASAISVAGVSIPQAQIDAMIAAFVGALPKSYTVTGN